ncbi:MAG: flagellar brake protein [Nitrospinales bacterium]
MATLKGELYLVLGQKVTVTIQGESYNVCIRGWLLNEYIITDIPKVQGQPLSVPMETGCQVRYIRDGVVYMFDTVVLSMFTRAISFMIIEYPKSHEKIKLRKIDRLKANLSVTYSEGPNSVMENATVRDLTAEGALLCHLRPLAKMTKIVLKIEFPDEPVENIEAVVRNVRHNNKSKKEPCVTGVKFIRVPEKDQGILQKFLKKDGRLLAGAHKG